MSALGACAPRSTPPPPERPLPLKLFISEPYRDPGLKVWAIPIGVTNESSVAISTVFVTCTLKDARGRLTGADVGVVSNLAPGARGSTDIIHEGSQMPPATCRISGVLR